MKFGSEASRQKTNVFETQSAKATQSLNRANTNKGVKDHSEYNSRDGLNLKYKVKHDNTMREADMILADL